MEAKLGHSRIKIVLQDHSTNSMDMHLRKLHETVEDRGACCDVVHGVAKSQT